MKSSDFSVENIRELMVNFTKNNLKSMSLECEGLKLCFEAKEQEERSALSPARPDASAPNVTAQPLDTAAEGQDGTVVTSPIVGTFYSCPAPGKPVFAPVGKRVKKGDVLFIIESMKLMNEIVSEANGTVAQLFVENGQSVEYGQPIMRIV